MAPEALRALLDSLPIVGPVMVLQFLAIVWLAFQWRAALTARVEDAKETTATLVEVGNSTTQAMGGLRSAVESLRQSDSRTREVLTQVRDALPRRTR